MIEAIEQVDHAIFLWINSGWSNGFFDFLFPVIRDKVTWLPLYFFFLLFFWWNRPKWKFWQTILLIAAVMGLSDTMSSKVVKPYFERARPCQHLELENQVTERVRCGSGYSLTSSHATNHFALAMILFLILGSGIKYRWLLFIWAGLIALAQVYVGVHFPLDIILGALMGLTIAFLMYRLTVKSRWFSVR